MAIRWDKLTVKSQEAMQQAIAQASELGNPEVAGRVHLLLTLIADREGVILPVLEKIGVATERLEAELHATRRNYLGFRVRRADLPRRSLSNRFNKAASRRSRKRELQGRVTFDGASTAGAGPRKGRSGGGCAAGSGRDTRCDLKALTVVRGSSRVTDQNPEGKFRRSKSTRRT